MADIWPIWGNKKDNRKKKQLINCNDLRGEAVERHVVDQVISEVLEST